MSSEDGKDQPHPLHLRADRWLQAVEDFHTSSSRLPTSGSPRAEDFGKIQDTLDPAYIASGKLLAAHDAARALSLLWNAGHVHNVADYALLRTIIECAGAAWWILEGRTPRSRFVRAYVIARDDLESARRRETQSVRYARTDEGREKRTAVVNRVNQLITRSEKAITDAGYGDERVVQKWVRFDLSETVLKKAQEHLGQPDLTFTLAWSLLSSLAHGSITSVIGFADTTPPDASDVPQRFVGTRPESVQDLAAAVDILFQAANREWFRYSDSVSLHGTPSGQ